MVYVKTDERLKLKIIFLLFAVFLFSGCDNHKEKMYKIEYSSTPVIENKTYIFGVLPLHNPKELFEVYQPLVDYLNKHLSKITIQLEASTNYTEFDNKLFSHHFDFALCNPYQTVESTKYSYKIFGKMADDYNFKGVILVRNDSNIKSVNDLKGKNVSYPGPTALAATMMPQRYLQDHGLDINKDVTNLYVGSQDSSVMSVYLKKSAAASVWFPSWIVFKKERPDIAKELKIMWETQTLPSNGLVVKESIDQALVSKIATLIFNLHTTKEGREILKPMELNRFEKADDNTYNSVRAFLQKFEKDIRPIRLYYEK